MTRTSFATKLSRIIVFVTSCLLILLLLFQTFVGNGLLRESAHTNAETSLQAIISEVTRHLQTTEAVTAALSWNASELRSNPRFFRDSIVAANIQVRVLEYTPASIGCGIFVSPEEGLTKTGDTYGFYSYKDIHTGQIAVCNEDATDEWDPDDQEWFTTVMQTGEPHWQSTYCEDMIVDSLYIISYGYPVKDGEGEVVSVMCIDFSVDWLKDKLIELRPYDDCNICIVDEHGDIVCNPMAENPFVGTVFDTLIFPAQQQPFSRDDLSDANWQALNDSLATGKVVSYEDDDSYTFYACGQLPNGWTVIVGCPLYEVNIEAIVIVVLFVLEAILGLVLLFFVCRFVIRRASRPISAFAQAATRLSQGHFEETQLHTGGSREMVALKEALDTMRQNFQDYIAREKTTAREHERLHSELQIAHQIQTEMLRHDFPSRQGLDLYATMTAAKEVGGDLYEFQVCEDGVLFVIGDVSGKGVPAAMLMAIIQSSIRLLGGLQLDMAQLADRINKVLCQSTKTDLFVTLFLGHYDFATHRLQYCNAGHNPLVVIEPDSEPRFLDVKPNLVCGIMDDFPYEEQTIAVTPGTRLVLYTDGVTEAERADKEQYGDDRLLAWANTAPATLTAQQAAEDLLHSVRSFTDGADQNDDITILTLRLG